jgi:hypothetical protein
VPAQGRCKRPNASRFRREKTCELKSNLGATVAPISLDFVSAAGAA